MNKDAYYLPVPADPTLDGKPRVGFIRVTKEKLTEAQKAFVAATDGMDRSLLRTDQKLSAEYMAEAKKLWAAE